MKFVVSPPVSTMLPTIGSYSTDGVTPVSGVPFSTRMNVTWDPEPLPPGHPLWSLPNCLITPHVGNTPEMAAPLLAQRISTNVRRFAAGDELLGPIDVDAGY